MQTLQVFIFVALTYCCYSQRPSFLPSFFHRCVPDGSACSVNADCCSQTCTNTTSLSLCATSTTNEVRPQENTLSNRFNGCQGVGNNCNVGQDCCSQACLDFRCIENRQNTSTGIPQINNRVGEEQRNCRGVNQRCSTQQDCCMFLACERSMCRDKSVFVTGTETLGYQEGPYLNNRFGEENQTNSSPNRPVAKCMDIGEKCFKPEECCSPLKCHSFLNKCVT